MANAMQSSVLVNRSERATSSANVLESHKSQTSLDVNDGTDEKLSTTINRLTKEDLKLQNFWLGVANLVESYRIQRKTPGKVYNHHFVHSTHHEESVHRFLLHPHKRPRIVWDTFLACLLLYSVIVIPLRVGFDITPNTDANKFDDFITAMFGFDIIIQFNSLYYNVKAEQWVSNRFQIARHYLMSMWFWIDLLATIPFDRIIVSLTTVSSTSSSSNQLGLIRLIRILRLFRIMKLLNYTTTNQDQQLISVDATHNRSESTHDHHHHQSQQQQHQHTHHHNEIHSHTPSTILNELQIIGSKLYRIICKWCKLDPLIINLFKLLLQIFFIAHLFACCWHFIAIKGIVPTVETTWIESFDYTNTTVSSRYAASLYFVTVTMLTIGYGDIYATNEIERIFAIVAMIIGGVIFGALVGQVAQAIDKRNPQEQAFNKKMYELKLFLADANLSLPLRDRAKSAYAYYLEKRSSYEELSIYDKLTPSIVEILVLEVYSKDISKINLWQHLLHSNLSAVSSMVVHLMINSRPCQIPSRDIIFAEGDICCDIAFIKEGSIRLDCQDSSTLCHHHHHHGHGHSHDGGSTAAATGASGGGKMILIGYLTQGDMFGDCEYYQNVTSLCTYTAVKHTQLLLVSHANIRIAIEKLDNHVVRNEIKSILKQRNANLISILKKSKHDDIETVEDWLMILDKEDQCHHNLLHEESRKDNGMKHDSDDGLIHDDVLEAHDDVHDNNDDDDHTDDDNYFHHSSVNPETKQGLENRETLKQLICLYHNRRKEQQQQLADDHDHTHHRNHDYEAVESGDHTETDTNHEHQHNHSHDHSHDTTTKPIRPSQLQRNSSISNMFNVANATASAMMIGIHHYDDLKTLANTKVHRLIYYNGKLENLFVSPYSLDLLIPRHVNAMTVRVVIESKLTLDDGRVMCNDKVVEWEDWQLGEQWLIHPDGIYKLCWNFIIAFLIIYSVLVIPVELAFQDRAFNNSNNVNLIISLLFFIDIILCFRTCQISHEYDALILDPTHIARHYLRLWFWIDIISTIPWDDMLNYLTSGNHSFQQLQVTQLVKLTRMFRLMRVIRAFKLKMYLEKFEGIIGISPMVFELFSLLIQVFFIVHITCCIWWGFTASVTTEPWFGNTIDLDSSLSRKYLLSLYFTFTTMSTVGYGDLHPQAVISEQLFGCILVILGASTFGYMIANVSNVLNSSSQNTITSIQKEELHQMSEYLQEKQCSNYINQIVMNHCQRKYLEKASTSAFDIDAMTNCLPPTLRVEILSAVYSRKMKKIPIFSHIKNQSIKLYLFQRLTPTFYDIEQFIIREGDIGKDLIFIVNGTARAFQSDPLFTMTNTTMTKKRGNRARRTGSDASLKSIKDQRYIEYLRHLIDPLPKSSAKPTDPMSTSPQSKSDRDLHESNESNSSKGSGKLERNHARGMQFFDNPLSTMVSYTSLSWTSHRNSNNEIDASPHGSHEEEYVPPSQSHQATNEVYKNRVKSFAKCKQEHFEEAGYRLLGDISPGDFVGHISFMSCLPHEASVRPLSLTTAYLLSKADLANLIRNESGVGIQLQSAIARAVYAQSNEVGRFHMRRYRAKFLKSLKYRYYEHYNVDAKKNKKHHHSHSVQRPTRREKRRRSLMMQFQLNRKPQVVDALFTDKQVWDDSMSEASKHSGSDKWHIRHIGRSARHHVKGKRLSRSNSLSAVNATHNAKSFIQLSSAPHHTLLAVEDYRKTKKIRKVVSFHGSPNIRASSADDATTLSDYNFRSLPPMLQAQQSRTQRYIQRYLQDDDGIHHNISRLRSQSYPSYDNKIWKDHHVCQGLV